MEKTKKVVILPFDGFPDGVALLDNLHEVFSEPGVNELVAYVKLNDGVHNDDFGGPEMVKAIGMNLWEVKKSDAEIFLDLKIFDVSQTLENVLKKYSGFKISILTVCYNCSVAGIRRLRKLLPETKLAMVSIPTDISQEECLERFGMTPDIRIYNDLQNIRRIYQRESPGEEPFDLVVCSPHEVKFLDRNIPESYGFIVPGIRDAWMKKANEHQKRTTGVGDALSMAPNRNVLVVMGGQMIKGNPEMNISPEESRRLTSIEIAKATSKKVIPGDPFGTLKLCGGYYHCPMGEGDVPLGPLTGYAGTYETESGLKNYVGLEYFNFARAETDDEVRAYFAKTIAHEMMENKVLCDVFLGAPMGGILLAGELGSIIKCRTVFAEKEPTALADPSSGKKAQSNMIIARHDIYQGDDTVIVEDVCNNFSTTQKLKDLIESRGGKLSAIVCAFNRSGKTYWNDIPVISAHFIPTQQFRQDEPGIKELMEEGKIVWKPKDEWDKLLTLQQ